MIIIYGIMTLYYVVIYDGKQTLYFYISDYKD